MTAFGKILVFLNLVFALLTGGLISMVYLTRTNWHNAYEKAVAGASGQKADFEQLLSQEMDLANRKERQAKDAEAKAEDTAKRLQTAQVEVDQLKAQLASTQKTNDNTSENVKTTTTELERRRNEVKQLTESNTRFADRIRDLEKQLTKTRDEAVTNKLNYAALKERMDSVLAQNEDLSRRMNQLERAGITTARGGERAPPPDAVRGTVKAVDGNLVTVSVGTDAGVNKDNALYVYRLGAEPKYLGELTILSATPFEAVGRLRPASRSVTVKAGDEVASRILGPK